MAPTLRWQPIAVATALLLPPVGLAVAVWPASSEGGGGGGSTDPVPLAVGDREEGEIGFNGVAVYEITVDGDGPLQIDVLGGGADPTLTLVDESGEQLGFNDDTDGVDSTLVVDLDEGDLVRAEVRNFSGQPMTFEIRAGDPDDLDDGDRGPETTIPAPPRVPVAPTTIVSG